MSDEITWGYYYRNGNQREMIREIWDGCVPKDGWRMRDRRWRMTWDMRVGYSDLRDGQRGHRIWSEVDLDFGKGMDPFSSSFLIPFWADGVFSFLSISFVSCSFLLPFTSEGSATLWTAPLQPSHKPIAFTTLNTYYNIHIPTYPTHAVFFCLSFLLFILHLFVVIL